MCDFREIADVKEYLRDPYLDCVYVRICGGLLRLRKTYTLKNYRRPNKQNLSAADLAKTQCFNISNKKLDLMVSINYRRDGNIIHLQNKIKYLESLTPEEVERLHSFKLSEKRRKARICVAIKDKLFQIMSKMNRMGCYDEQDGLTSFRSVDTEELARKLRSPDDILEQLDKFEKYHLKSPEGSKKPKTRVDKCVQTELAPCFTCKCQQRLPGYRTNSSQKNTRYLAPGGDYIYNDRNHPLTYSPRDEPLTLYKNYDYHYAECEDTDHYSLECEALSSGRATEDSWHTYTLKYKSLPDDYDKRYRIQRPRLHQGYGRYKKNPSKRNRSCSPPKMNVPNIQKRSRSVPKQPLYYSKDNVQNFQYSAQRFAPTADSCSVTTLYFNDSLSKASSVHSDYYSDTSTYSGFYTQEPFRDYYEPSEDDLGYECEYEVHYRRRGASKGCYGGRKVMLVNGYCK